MINNRQAGRRRGRGGQQQRPQGGSNGRDTGNRIDNRSRGNAAQLLEKYKTLARDAQMAGDRVNTEYYLQFADHYFRVLAETRSRFEENRQPMQGGANTFQDDEQDYNDDGEPIVRADQPQPRQQDGNRQDGNRQNGGQQNYQGERSYNGNQQNGQYAQPQDRQPARGERNERNDRGDDRPRGYEGERLAQDDRGPRSNGARPDRYRDEDEAPREEMIPAPAPAPMPVAAEEGQPQEAPRRRGRPRREPAVADAPARDADGLPGSIFEAIGGMDAAPPAGDEPEKPRRRRGRPPASEATSAS